MNSSLPAPTSRPIRVLVVDDHPIVLAGLVTALAQQPDIEMVVSASDREEADRLLQEHRIDVGLVDASGAAVGRTLANSSSASVS